MILPRLSCSCFTGFRYRFLHEEVLAFEDGGALLWRNSDHEPKCRASSAGVPKDPSSATMVRSHVWFYHWPKTQG